MNSSDLYAAAAKIEAGAEKRIRWAQSSDDKAWRDLYLGAAQQLQDRANQVRSWAVNSAYLESRGEERERERQEYIESATREFLATA